VRAVNKFKALRQSSLNREKSGKPASNTDSTAHRHTKSLEFDYSATSIPQTRKYFHDHLTVQSPSDEDDTKQFAPLPPPTDSSETTALEEPTGPIEAPRTPKIQVQAPPEEPSSEDEIQYIGVGLGTLSTLDKKRRKSPADLVLADPHLQTRSSSESIRSDTSITSGQLTPKEPMVYNSPTITHDNVFEAAFQRAEDKIRLMRGDDAMIYNTWRSEEIKGQPVTNRHGREKVELERIDEADERPRWERVMMEKFPEKLAELYSGKGKRLDVLKETKEMLGTEAKRQWEMAKAVKDNVMNDPAGQPGYVGSHEEKRDGSRTGGQRAWDKLLGKRAQRPIGAVKGMMGSLNKTMTGVEPESTKQQDPSTQDGDTTMKED
jgi:hypothetical protein